MIEQLVDGAFSIGDAFLKMLQDLGLDFDSFEDILNAIIDFFEGIFGGGEEDTTKAQATTNAANATTSAGSVSGSEGTGDAGIALAATVCVAAAATFVLTRKKKED